jgi:hypothetical protein
MATEPFLSLLLPATTLTVVEDTGAFKNGLKTWIFNKAFGE